MNDLVRLISKSLEPFGYHVRPRNGLNFLRIPNLEKEPNVNATRKTMNKIALQTPEANLGRLIIYLRTCMRDKRNIDTRPRLTSADLTEHSLRCILSLIRSINHATKAIPDVKIELCVLDDHSDSIPLQNLKTLLKQLRMPFTVETTQTTGQGASLYEQFSKARDQDAITYFCEDDYLHEENGIATLIIFYHQMAKISGNLPVLYPQEHNTLYSHHYPSYIVQGEDRHWRSVRHATHTFMTHGKIVEKYWSYFENTKFVGNRKKRKLGSEARTTNKLFKHVPGFSPLTPCAVHLQFEELLPPFYDWRPLWERNALPEKDELAA